MRPRDKTQTPRLVFTFGWPNRMSAILLALLLVAVPVQAQSTAPNKIIESSGIPPIPSSIVGEVRPYSGVYGLPNTRAGRAPNTLGCSLIRIARYPRVAIVESGARSAMQKRILRVRDIEIEVATQQARHCYRLASIGFDMFCGRGFRTARGCFLQIQQAYDLRLALRGGCGQQLEFGGVLVNEVPTFRTDQMPYGGVKDSGNTKEGPHYSVRELTEERLVTFQG